MPEPVRVFVSYASPDRAFAERLVTDLQAAGAEVWWDVSGIDEGDFLRKIDEALQRCDWFVLVLTSHAVASNWVKKEVYAVLHRREKGLMRGVLPVLASPVAHDAMPPTWDNLHRYDAVGDYQGEVTRLIRTLGLSGAPAEPPRGASARPAAPPYVVQSDRFPPRLAELGYRVAFLNGAEIILPPVCDVLAGPFLMGSDPNTGAAAEKREQPQHSVTLAAFQIGKFPVTVAEYACFVRAGQKEPEFWRKQLGNLDHPVLYVSWHDAVAYVGWIAAQTGHSWRLPSEAEWEKAARGTDGRIYPWGDQFDDRRANVTERGKNRGTTPVGSYPNGASPYGALDMTGNVWEWTGSALKPYPYNAGDGREWADPSAGRAIRGGSSGTIVDYARAASRDSFQPGVVYWDVGFRVVLAVPSS